jgi:hypothetical protein
MMSPAQLQTRLTPPSPESTVISRPTKRHVRPRAATEAEKQTRAKERKEANREAAKHSRNRQKQAMEDAQHENDRLSQENKALHARLANLEQRMQEMESRRQEKGNTSTHQPARPMIVEPQCPNSPCTMTSLLPRPTSPCLTSRVQIWAAMYVLQMWMHSFALSVASRIPLTQVLTKFQYSRRQRLRDHKRNLFSRQWMGHIGYATPNHVDSRGAIKSPMLRERMKTLARPRRTWGKDLLRLVRREQKQGKSGRFIRLIVKKAGKRMNK